MGIWDFADKHPVAFVFCILFLSMAVPSFSYARKKTGEK